MNFEISSMVLIGSDKDLQLFSELEFVLESRVVIVFTSQFLLDRLGLLQSIFRFILRLCDLLCFAHCTLDAVRIHAAILRIFNHSTWVSAYSLGLSTLIQAVPSAPGKEACCRNEDCSCCNQPQPGTAAIFQVSWR